MKKNIDRDVVKLEASAAILKDITVTAMRPFITQKIDRTVINVANSIVMSGGTVLDVLEKAPGVTVDRQSNIISLMGQEGVIVYIDGKQSYLSMADIITLLKTMPAAVLGPEMHKVHQRMANALSYDGIILIGEEYLWKRIQSLKTDFYPIDNVIQLMAAKPGFFSLERMAGEACLSVSQFDRKFTQLTGITPNFFSRINRFYHAYQLKDRNPNSDWLSMALEAGYYDYQHLVKDFKQFANVTPHSLLKAQALLPERILGIV